MPKIVICNNQIVIEKEKINFINVKTKLLYYKYIYFFYFFVSQNTRYTCGAESKNNSEFCWEFNWIIHIFVCLPAGMGGSEPFLLIFFRGDLSSVYTKLPKNVLEPHSGTQQNGDVALNRIYELFLPSVLHLKYFKGA